MTVSIPNNIIIYTGDGVTTVFPFNFWVQKEIDVRVYLKVIATGALIFVNPINYTVSGASLTVNGGGSITYDLGGALSSAYQIIIVRVLQYTQDLDISNQGGFTPEPLELQLDRLEMQIQQLAENVSRGVVSPYGELGWAIEPIDEGHVWVAGPAQTMIDGGDASNIADAQMYAEQAAQSAADAAAYGAAKYYVTAAEYSAPVDGTTDATTQLAAADAAAVLAGKPLYLTPGSYRVNSNLTLNAKVVMFGVLKPNSGVTITLSGTFESGPYKCFDTSLGGTIAGSPILPNGKVYSEWWGANPFNSAFDSQSAIQAAVTFIGQRSVSSGAAKGAILQLLTGWYRIESAVTFAAAGIVVEGCGPYATYLYIVGNIDGFIINGAQDGSAASYGCRFRRMHFYGSTTKPIGGKQLKFYRAKEFIVDDCWFTNFYQGLDCQNCQGPLIKELRGLNFVTSAALPTIASSACILLRGEPAGPGTTLCENVHITDCIGAPTIAIDFGIFIDGADTVHLNGNHFAGQKIATLYIASASCNVYNIHSSNNCWEGLNNYSQYAMYLANAGAATMNCFMFSTDQFLNGNVAMITVTGTSTNFVNHVVIGDCELLQALANGIVLDNCKSVVINGNAMTDCDVLAAGNKSWIVVGGGATDPVDVIISDNVMGNEYGGGTVAHGVWVLGGTGIAVNDNIIRDVTDAITNTIQAELSVSNNRTTMTQTLASANAVNPSLGQDKFYVTGTTQMNTISSTAEAKDRKLSFRFGSGLTVKHDNATGGYWLDGGVDFVPTAGSWLHVTLDDTNHRWVETGRVAI